MQDNNHLHKISPEKGGRGEKAWEEAKELIPSLCNKPLLLGRSNYTYKIREFLSIELSSMGLNVLHEELNFDCCEIAIALPMIPVEMFIIGPPTQSAFVVFNSFREFFKKSTANSIFCPCIINVLLLSGAGKTLNVISVRATNVP